MSIVTETDSEHPDSDRRWEFSPPLQRGLKPDQRLQMGRRSLVFHRVLSSMRAEIRSRGSDWKFQLVEHQTGSCILIKGGDSLSLLEVHGGRRHARSS